MPGLLVETIWEGLRGVAWWEGMGHWQVGVAGSKAYAIPSFSFIVSYCG